MQPFNSFSQFRDSKLRTETEHFDGLNKMVDDKHKDADSYLEISEFLLTKNYKWSL